MAEKPPPNRMMWVAIGGAVIIAALVLFLTVGPKGPQPPDPTNEVGPDTVQADPSSPLTAAPTQLALADPISSPAGDSASTPTSLPADPVVRPQSVVDRTPSRLSFSDATLRFEASFPGPATDPLIAHLRADAQTFLDGLKPSARSAHRGDAPPWRVIIAWSETARAGGLVSYFGTANVDRGGAHPQPQFDSLISREGAARPIAFDALMVPERSPSPAMIIAICEALKAEKTRRVGSPNVMGDPIVCAGPQNNIHIEDAIKVLAPSNQPNRFGGAYVHYAPYTVGSYAEGDYMLTIPQNVFAADLRAEYKPLFAGDPQPPRR
jgi:hypothetical protein